MKIGFLLIIVSCIHFAPAGGYTLLQQSFFVSMADKSEVPRPTVTMSPKQETTPLPEVDSREDIHIYTARNKVIVK
jgi:hypothetical protein